MSLKEYKKKRKLKETPEPKAEMPKTKTKKNIFVIQKHDASHLHYDFRLSIGNILKSWAIPKGPSVNPSHKRLAILTEDHPLQYQNFEGTIPEGHYGAGTVIVWDKGTYENLSELTPEQSFEKGSLKFQLNGKKLKGGFTLIRFRPPKHWLLKKAKDNNANAKTDILKQDKSVKSGRTIEQIEKKVNFSEQSVKFD
jgi:bifunctional non-homologous end joining protein LigD